jgi:peptidoglycan/xylan/chitin deacetylase (PgdA/CDA1 family)
MKNIPILVYHRVCRDEDHFNSPYIVTQSTFRRQMSYLATHGYRTTTVAEAMDGDLPASKSKGSPVLLTFDDGFLDNYLYAAPVLREFGFGAIVFLVADFKRRTNWWDVPDGMPLAELMARTHIEELSGQGMEFGSHTMTHKRLPLLSDEELNQELVESRRVIEAIVGRPVDAFSYPYSALDARAKQAVSNAGYRWAFAVNSGPVHYSQDPLEIRRVNMGSQTNFLRMHARLSGIEKRILWLYAKGKELARVRGT